MHDEPPAAEKPITPQVVERLVANHRDFLSFVERRIGTRALAEEIVQDAFAKSLDHADEIRDSVVGWFYRVLRNAVIDHQRRQAVADRRLDQFAAELDASAEADEELAKIACGCVLKLADTLKPEYSDALRRIEVDQMSVKDYADANGISPNNAGVRIFRAREALRKQVARSCGTCAEHGCLDCTCGSLVH
jgi:RNA polymerase sigma factor (sigma-70 family)